MRHRMEHCHMKKRTMDDIKTVTICGAGTMGTWLTEKLNKYGFTTCLFDIDENIVRKKTSEGFSATNDLKLAIKSKDLILETIDENIEAKHNFYKKITPFIEDCSLITSNTSVLLPDDFLGDFPYRDRFACLHFYSPNTAVDICPLPETSPKAVKLLIKFAHSIEEEPIVLKNPNRGYVFSAIAAQATDEAIDLVIRNIVDCKTVDQAWRAITKMSVGPFQMLDIIGIDTSLKIRKERMKHEEDNHKLLQSIKLLEDYVKQGKLGQKTKQGFYNYE